MSEEDFLDWEAPEDQIEEDSFPTVQWVNGRPGLEQIHPVLGNGGFEAPFDSFGNIVGDTIPITEVTHGRSKSPAYLYEELNVAVIAEVFGWEREDENGQTSHYSKRKGTEPGRTRIFCVIKEFGPEPIVITFKGTSGRGYSITKNAHKQILSAAGALQNRKYPRYMFWMTIKAGDFEEVGSGKDTSDVTPPAPAWNPADFSQGVPEKKMRKNLADLYVGNEIRDLIAGTLYEEGQAWAAEFNSRKDPDGVQSQQGQAAIPGNVGGEIVTIIGTEDHVKFSQMAIAMGYDKATAITLVQMAGGSVTDAMEQLAQDASAKGISFVMGDEVVPSLAESEVPF